MDVSDSALKSGTKEKGAKLCLEEAPQCNTFTWQLTLIHLIVE